MKIPDTKCIHCGKPLEDETQEYCRDCARRKSNYRQGRGLWLHVPPVSDAVYRLKYHNKRSYAEDFGKELAEAYKEQIGRWEIQEIIPIPLHWSKKRKRGYNQAELIADQLGVQLNLPVRKDVLFRIKKTKPLKQMDGEERRRNLQGAFAVSGAWKPCRNVLLIDDIYTTGSTIERAAGMLRKAGAENVYFLTLSIGQGI